MKPDIESIYQPTDEPANLEKAGPAEFSKKPDPTEKWERDFHGEIVAALASPRPEKPVPAILRQMVFGRLQQPLYKVWHLLLALAVLALSPLLLLQFSTADPHLVQSNQDIKILMYIGFGLFTFLLLFPLSWMLWESLDHRDPDWDKNPLGVLAAAFHRVLPVHRVIPWKKDKEA